MNMTEAVKIVKSKYPRLTLDERALEGLFLEYDLDTPNRLAGFIAQCAHESANFKAREENLNYSAKALRSVFGKYFKTTEEAEAYARQPEKIASKVYGNRMGNGDESSKDGYTYRGRGFIQLTGKRNYESYAKFANISLEEAVSSLSTELGALKSALFYWKTNNLNKYCDNNDIKGMTKAINGGYIGLADRSEHYNALQSQLANV